ncbi:hypothetical protein [Pseudomonas indica]|uniref:hypothetical protein n=1 Tax=Pseudomonas indica TaxID=137658 RepID=UPI0023F8CA18|nr:hypothetical protein [Pseudomonas indica]MBU3058208.1 hypothetical protein [Pseudomonas indica]
MRELIISEMEIVGGGVDGDQATAGAIVTGGGAWAATSSAAAGAVAATAAGVIAVGVGSFIVADAIINDGALMKEMTGGGDDGDDE